MTLEELETGESAIIEAVGGQGRLRQHLLDMGIIPGAKVKMIRFAPMGDPIEFRIHDYELTLRANDASRITIRPADDTETAERLINALHSIEIEHPGLGEEGKYHVPGESQPLPDGTILTFALAGNQNSGKTTLFNQLTGASQRVGNFPGVTVDKTQACLKDSKNAFFLINEG